MPANGLAKICGRFTTIALSKPLPFKILFYYQFERQRPLILTFVCALHEQEHTYL